MLLLLQNSYNIMKSALRQIKLILFLTDANQCVLFYRLIKSRQGGDVTVRNTLRVTVPYILRALLLSFSKAGSSRHHLNYNSRNEPRIESRVVSRCSKVIIFSAENK